MKIALTRQQYEHLVENMDDWAMSEADVRCDYSGRGMYGTQCVGVTFVDTIVPAAFLYFLAEELDWNFLELLSDLGGGGRDSMGLSTIAYWRNLIVDDAAEEDD